MVATPAPLPVAIRSLLERYGLGSLTAWAEQALRQNLSEEEVMLQLFDRPEFQAAFPEIEARRKKAADTGVIIRPISADEILQYRESARAMMRSYGLPSSFYSQSSDFFNLIVNDVSVDELNTRLENATQRVWQAPPEVRTAFDQLFGTASDTALFSVFVDVNKSLPALENMLQEAEAGGAAARFGFQLTEQEMQRIADYNVGSYGDLLEGFGMLDRARGLFDETLYETVDLNVGEEGVETAFGIGPQGALEKRAEQRKAETSGSRGASAQREGVTGLGTAEQR